jgi:hypothetical protein
VCGFFWQVRFGRVDMMIKDAKLGCHCGVRLSAAGQGHPRGMLSVSN